MNSPAISLAPQNQTMRLLYMTGLLVLGNFALILSSKLQITVFPVPFTLQTFVVLLIGASFGARLGGVTLLIYLLQGAMGLPVFASGGGLVYFTGPTAGYLIGFFVAVLALGVLCEKGALNNLFLCFCAMLFANVIIFSFGLFWLSFGIGLGWNKAVAVGLLPFVLPGMVKTILASLVAFFFNKTVIKRLL